MKIKYMSAFLVLAAGPTALFAASTDAKIEDAAKASYNYHTVLADEVHVSSNEGIVTLTGSVPYNEDKALAQDTVENLPGVISVRNEIEVKPVYPEHSDAWISLKIRGELLIKANVSAKDTTIDVKDGAVTLGGSANSIAQKDLTEAYAKGIVGVKSISNNIVVMTTGETVSEKIDDASITSQIKYTLLTHEATSAVKTKVTTTDGVAVITGEAGSGAERDLVTQLVSDVRGVKTVTNRMTLKS